jgi:hypothetical protein
MFKLKFLSPIDITIYPQTNRKLIQFNLHLVPEIMAWINSEDKLEFLQILFLFANLEYKLKVA